MEEVETPGMPESQHVESGTTSGEDTDQMTEITQNDAIDVGGGVGARSSTPAVDAGFAADAGSEGGGGAEWQMVTRGKAKAGGAKKTTDEDQTECGGKRRGLATGCARFRGCFSCDAQEKGRGQRQRQACGNGGDHRTAGDGSKAHGGEPEAVSKIIWSIWSGAPDHIGLQTILTINFSRSDQID